MSNQTEQHQWYSSLVYKGDQLGRTIGFPTLNLNAAVVDQNLPQGVYGAEVKINGQRYIGALYFGPRLVLNETKLVLEIFVLDFDQEVYGQEVEFSLHEQVRGIMPFASFEALKTQLQLDVTDVRQVMDES
jgi:riboflavin kinase / FMN adenylyltransferase